MAIYVINLREIKYTWNQTDVNQDSL